MDKKPTVTQPAETKKPAEAASNALEKEIEKDPLAPSDPRLRKPGNEPLQSNQDPLNGVNE